MLNYELDADLLRPYLPAGTELDRHDGRVFASIVAFRFLHTRVLGVPVPGHRHFTELNLRFYVRRETDHEVRRGVVFIREVVPRAAIAAVARLVYNEPYVRLPMRHRPGTEPVRYEWRLGTRWHSVQARVDGPGEPPAPGGHAEFITDHAWGYTRQRDGGTIEYRVAHERWAVSRAADLGVDADFAALYGPALGAQLSAPASAFLVAGSPVTVFRPVRLPERAAPGQRP